MFRVLPMKRDISGAFSKRAFDQSAREPKTAVIAKNSTSISHISNTRIWCLAEPNFFQNLIDGCINRLNSRRIQRFEIPPFEPGAYWPQILGQWRCTQVTSCFTATAAPRRTCDQSILNHQHDLLKKGPYLWFYLTYILP